MSFCNGAKISGDGAPVDLQLDRRVSDNYEVARIVVRAPERCQSSGRGADVGLLRRILVLVEKVGELGRDLREPFIHPVHGGADRPAIEHVLQTRLDMVVPLAYATAESPRPDPIHMSNDCQGAAVRVAEQLLGQRAHERRRSTIPRVGHGLLERIVVDGGRTGAVTSEDEGDETVEPGVLTDIGGREIVVATDGASMVPASRPILAQDSTLIASLIRVAAGKRKAMREGEEESRRLAAAEELS